MAEKIFSVNVADLHLPDGTTVITATVHAEGYESSDASNSVTLVVSNGEIVEQRYTINAGFYKFNETLTSGISYLTGDVNIAFTSNGESFVGFFVDPDGREAMLFKRTEDDGGDDSWKQTYCFWHDDTSDGGWHDGGKNDTSAYREIHITTNQDVSKEFYEWFVENTGVEILPGAYSFYSELTSDVEEFAEFSFTSNGTEFVRITLAPEGLDAMVFDGATQSKFVYSFNANKWYDLVTGEDTSSYRNISVAMREYASRAFRDWLYKNAGLSHDSGGSN